MECYGLVKLLRNVKVKEYIEQLKEEYGKYCKVFENVIPRYVKAEESVMFGESIWFNEYECFFHYDKVPLFVIKIIQSNSAL